MNLSSNLEKAFFTDMLANGIPVHSHVSLNEIVERLEDASNAINAFFVELVDQEIIVSNSSQASILKLSIKETSGCKNIVFFTNSSDEALENARIIGQVLFLLVTICSTLKYLDLRPGRLLPSSESIDFESDFI